MNSRSKNSGRSMSKSPLLWLIGFIVLALIVAIAFGGGGDDSTSTADVDPSLVQIADVTVTGVGLPVLESGTDAGVGQTAPTLTGISFDGTPVTIQPGAPKLVGFFAHWCPHCQNELPILSDWLANGGLPDGVDVVAVSTATSAEAPNYPPSVWFDEVGFSRRVLVDDADGSAANSYGLSGFPFWVVTDSEGRVVYRVAGEIGESQFAALAQLAAAAG